MYMNNQINKKKILINNGLFFQNQKPFKKLYYIRSVESRDFIMNKQINIPLKLTIEFSFNFLLKNI